MHISKVFISNYKSFRPEGESLYFYSKKTALIGKNNSGKTNLLSALSLLFGYKNPRYITLNESDYYNSAEPVFIRIEVVTTEEGEIYQTALPKKHKGTFYSKLKGDEENPKIIVQFTDALSDDYEPEDGKFLLEVAGLKVHKRINEIRGSLLKFITVPAIRSTKEDLKASTWTVYGNLMKSVIEDSERYDELKEELNKLNNIFIEVLNEEKEKVLNFSSIITFIDDLKFQLTKEGDPSELLRNLEILINEHGRFFHIEDTGTGTQSAVIMGILELALNYKSTQTKIFLIEEPELFLHPQGVKYLSSLFDNFLGDDLSQIILATHSSTLISTFCPIEIIRFDKTNMYTEIHQLPADFTDPNNKVTRALKSGKANMFFADKVFLVEGETEEILFPEISKILSKNSSTHYSFLRGNITTIRINGKSSLLNYVRILDRFNIQWKAILDNDLFERRRDYFSICRYLNIEPEELEIDELRGLLGSKGIGVLTKGETEDLIPVEDIANITGMDEEKVSEILSNYSKTSDAFEKEIFRDSKPDIAFDIVEYYSTKNKTPFDEIIKWVVN